MKRLMKLIRKTKNYNDFAKAVKANLHWYVGFGETRLQINTNEDLLKIYRILGGK